MIMGVSMMIMVVVYEGRDQLNMALILLSKVWSSRLSILMAWKYSLGSKYPLAMRKVCLRTSSCVERELP